MDGLTPGRIVHYVSDRVHEENGYESLITVGKGEHVAAIVTGLPLHSDGSAHLSVFFPGAFYQMRAINIPYDCDTKSPGTWHWPERA